MWLKNHMAFFCCFWMIDPQRGFD